MEIELVKADSNEFLNVTDATNAMELLMTREKVDFVVGGFRSEAVLAMQDIAMEYKKIFIGCGAAHPELCTRVAEDYDTYKYFFRGTPFNSSFLVRTAFIHMATVAGIMKATLNIPKIRVAVVAEKAMWADPLIPAAQGFIPKLGHEISGVWRPSPVATDVTAELSAIQRADTHVILTFFSSSVGIPFARQAGELKIPAALVGINVEAQKDGFWQATQGMGNYVMTLNTYNRNVEVNDLTKPFLDTYVKRFGEVPTYTADTYAAIIYSLVPVIEMTGTLDADRQVAVVIDGVDKRLADQCFARREILEFELPEEMFTERLATPVRILVDRAIFAVPATVLDALRGTGLPELVGFDGLDFGRGFGTRGRNVGEILHLQHDVLFESFLNLSIQVEDREL